MTDAEITQLIREEVEKALHPGVIDPSAYIRATITDPATGYTYRGLLYLVVPDAMPDESEKTNG